jgi:transposase
MIRELLDLLHSRDRELNGVRFRLDQLLHRLYGPKGEKFRPDQPTLFDLLNEAASIPPQPPAPPAEPTGVPQPTRKGHGRRCLPADLRREIVVHDLPEADKVCPCCQTPRIKIGEEMSEQLDYQPAKMFVWQHVRLKYACPSCAKAAATPLPSAFEPSAKPVESPEVLRSPASLDPSIPATPPAIGSTVVVVAPKPAQPIDKGLPGAGLLAFVTTSKYADHLPLHRQEEILARHGVDIPRSTLCDWMAAVAHCLRPLYEAMLAQVLLSRVIQIDETRLPVLEKGNDQTKSGRLWTLVGDQKNPHTTYFYTPTKARAGPAVILENYKGFLQADAANVFDGFYLPGDIIEVGCWAHTRRYFHEARTSDAARSAEALARIGFFYTVEREATATITKEKLTDAAAEAYRLNQRRERTLPKIQEFQAWMDEQAKVVLPKSPIAQAIAYAQRHWQALLRFTEQGFLNIDNNASERALRAAAVGRKNYLFVGSDEGGRTAAVLYSFTQTCRRHGIDSFNYLRDVLTRLPQADYQDLSDLFPFNWAQAQRANAQLSAES